MTRQQYELNCEILQSLDKIDNCVMESETLVMNSMLNAYSKAALVLEHCSDTADLSSFNIIQESFILEDGEGELTDDKGNNKEKLIKKILLFIPRLIMKAVNFIKGKLSGRNTTKKLLQRIDELEKMSKADKEKIIQLINDMKSDNRLARGNMYVDLQNQIDDIRQTTNNRLNHVYDSIGNIRANSIKARAELNSKLDNTREKLDDTRNVLQSRIADNELRTDKIKRIIDVMNNNIRVDLDFNKIKNMYNNILHIFELLEKYDIHKPSTISSDIQKTISTDKMDAVVKNRIGSSEIDNLDIFVDDKNGELMKLSDFKKNLNDILEIRYKITTVGKLVSDSINLQVKELNKSIMDKNKKIGTSQQAKLDQAKTVSDYISYYTRIVLALERAYEKELFFAENDFKVIKSLYIDAVK